MWQQQQLEQQEFLENKLESLLAMSDEEFFALLESVDKEKQNVGA